MRWGVEVWDKFEDVSNYVHKGIEFSEKYEEFWKKRCSIENSYAKNLRKLIEAFEPKKRDINYIAAASAASSASSTSFANQSTYLACFVKMLNELRDSAGQHELIAENVQEKILAKIGLSIKQLKEERRKCIDEKEKFYAEHQACDEHLEKCKFKYEKAFREVEKAEEALVKVENDDSASKNDIKKQKNICDSKKRIFDTLEAEYGKQLCEANRVKNVYYYEQLPAIFDSMQTLETRRIAHFQSWVSECTSIEIEVLPRIHQCLKEIEAAACAIRPEQDTEICVNLYKTGYQIPADHVFAHLNSDKHKTNIDSTITTNQQQLNGSINSNNSNGSSTTNHYSTGTLGGHATMLNSSNTLNNNNNTNNNMNSRQKKYRTLNRIKGLFLATSASGKNENDIYNLPPQQLKNELLKKINQIQLELDKQHKEREGLNKLKDIYSKNQKFGDSQSAESALKANEEKISSLNNQLAKYQEILQQVELNVAANAHSHQQHYNKSSNGEYSSTSSSSIQTSSTLPREMNMNHIYQSSGKLSIDSTNQTTNGIACSLPSTPLSNHNHPNNNNNNVNHQNYNGTVAYAVSPVSQLNQKLTQKQAPLVSTNNNESFDDEDQHDEDDEDEDDEDGCYESPTAALRNKIENYHNHQLSQTAIKTETTTTTSTTIASTNANGTTVGFVYAHETTNGSSGGEQYDHVDHNSVYDQSNGLYIDDNEPIIGTALVMYSFAGTVQNAMSIQESESLNVLEKDSGDGWTLVKRLNGEKGYVPTDYIQIVYY